MTENDGIQNEFSYLTPQVELHVILNLIDVLLENFEKIDPKSHLYLLFKANCLYEKKDFSSSSFLFLRILTEKYDCKDLLTQKKNSNFVPLLAKIISSLLNSFKYSEALVLIQLLNTKSFPQKVVFLQLVTDNVKFLDPFYFRFIWDISILEILLHKFAYFENSENVSLITSLISKPQLNQSNSRKTKKMMKQKLIQDFIEKIQLSLHK